jgi:deoxyribose-phosphate aldolase
MEPSSIKTKAANRLARMTAKLKSVQEPSNMARHLDHTVLKQDTTQKKVIALLEQAVTHNFAAVCINSVWIPLARKYLQGHDVNICTVVGFPLGAVPKEVKAFETAHAVAAGADEIDMVINIGFLKSKFYKEVLEDVQAVVKAAAGKTVKVIIECCLLTDAEKEKACKICVLAGAQYVKTSTGFSKGGATLEDVFLMKETVGDKALVKAAGGVRTFQDACKFIHIGAERIGTSGGHKIVQGKQNDAY